MNNIIDKYKPAAQDNLKMIIYFSFHFNNHGILRVFRFRNRQDSSEMQIQKLLMHLDILFISRKYFIHFNNNESGEFNLFHYFLLSDLQF